MSGSKPKGKPFVISKWVVWEAYEKVKANQGAAGVDEESIAEFEGDLKANLYKLWNRMSSGSYFPPPVRAVEIPKAGRARGRARSGCPPWLTGSPRPWSRCTWSRRWNRCSTPTPTAIGRGGRRWTRWATCRERCWKTDWVIDLDIRAFFDSLDHDLVLRAVSKHTDLRWVLLYVERWLKAPLQRRGRHRGAREIAGPRRGRRSRPCWRTCSSTTRSTAGWRGSSRPSASSATRTTWWCTAQPRPRPARPRRHRRAAGAGRSGAASGQDAHRVLQGRQPARLP